MTSKPLDALTRLEVLAERWLEGGFARLFRIRLHQAELAEHLRRALEDGQTAGPNGVWLAPDEYQVFLHPSDYAQLDDRQDQAELEKNLAGYLIEIARQSGATLMRRLQVRIHLSESIPFRQVQVQACLTSPPALADEPFQTREIDVPSSQEVNRDPMADAPSSSSAAPSVPSQAALTGTPIQTYHLLVDERFFSLVTLLVNLGRGLDNDLVINHPRVSRHHAQLQQREGQWWLIDLGSANGTAVNDQPISEMILQPGDVISLAGIEIRFESESPSSQVHVSSFTFHG
jgi:hypothetical protein